MIQHSSEYLGIACFFAVGTFGKGFTFDWMRPPVLGLTFLLLIQAVPVLGQVPSAGTENSDEGEQLRFQKTLYPDVHEGYVSLQWSDLLQHRPRAANYIVYDQDDVVVYRGSLPMAFVSGLPDGEHRFRVEALDAQGNVFARSEEPARVIVEHWSLFQAMLLFAIGLIVFLVLVAVIVHGTLRKQWPVGAAAEMTP